MKKVETYVATHKEFKIPTTSNIYIPMQGGASLYPTHDFGYKKDNTGDNISLKKEWYNELTTFYWSWKNSDADIKGLCHYRRFFYKSITSINPKYILEKKDIIDSLNNFDIILPYPYLYGNLTVRKGYSLSGKGLDEDLQLAKDTILKMYPDYIDSFNEVMLNNHASLCNALIASKEIYDAYASWLFSVIFEMESNMNLDQRKGQQMRAMGFLAERLLDVWVKKNGLKVKYYTLNMTDLKKDTKYYLRTLLEKIGIISDKSYLKKLKQ